MTFRRKINNKWYTSKEEDVHHNKQVLQKKAAVLRSVGRKCIIVPIKQGYRLFTRY